MLRFDGIVKRHSESRVRTALKDTRIVGLIGPRQSGKSTLAERMAFDSDMPVLSLDRNHLLNLARADPDGFLRSIDRAVIDEVQRVPELVLALKYSVDKDPRPGRFLITGSVDLFRSAITPDSLAGRIEFIELLPLSQAEIERSAPSKFLNKAFTNDFPKLKHIGYSSDLIERVVGGGYPEPLKRANSDRQREWLMSYSKSLVTRHLPEVARVNKLENLSKLLERLAVYAGQVTNLKRIATDLSVDEKTVDHWLTLFEQMFVVRRVKAWYRNRLKRLNKTPKLHFFDSGLLAALQGTNSESIKADRASFGQLLENFVFSELYKSTQLASEEISIYHYREQSVYEIDFVLEKAGKVVAIEVKASTGIKSDAFRTLRRLKDQLGESFVCGIILHDGDQIQSLSDNMYAMPVSQLWSQ